MTVFVHSSEKKAHVTGKNSNLTTMRKAAIHHVSVTMHCKTIS